MLDHLLNIFTQPLRKRLILVAVLTTLYTLLFVLFYVMQIGNLQTLFLVTLFAAVVTAILGVKWAAAALVLSISISRLVRGLFDLPAYIPSDWSLATGLILLFLICSAVGGLGSLLRYLARQRTTFTAVLWDREQALKALKESEKRYRLLVEDVSDVFYTCSIEGLFNYISPSVQQLTGYTAEALAGKHFSILLPPDWHESVGLFYTRQLDDRIPETVLEFPIVTAKGSRKWVEQRVVLVLDEAMPQEYHSIVREITHRKSLESDLENAKDEAVSALKMNTQILAHVSHDTRIPLSVIALNAEMLKRGNFGPLTEKQEQALNSILFGVHESLDFINNLLQKSRLDMSHTLKPVQTQIAIKDWLDEYAEMVQPLAHHKGLKLSTEIAAEMPDTLYSDVSWLKHILSNLVNNAIKFTDEGSIVVRLSRPDSHRWTLEVEDTGRGIDATAQPQVFEAFWQAKDVQGRSANGIGLGLSMVARFVEYLNGSVEVRSVPGQGSTFTVILPLTVDPPADERQPQLTADQT